MGDTSPTVSQTNVLDTPQSRGVAVRPVEHSREATRSHSCTASMVGTTHDGNRTRAPMHPSMRASTDRISTSKALWGSAPEPPALTPVETRRAARREGGWGLSPPSIGRPGGMPHRQRGRKWNSVLAASPPARLCCARPIDGGDRRQSAYSKMLASWGTRASWAVFQALPFVG